MEETQELKIVVKVDAQTGNLEIVNAQLQKTTNVLNTQSKNAKVNTTALEGLIKKYGRVITTFLTLTTILKSAIKQYDDEIVRQRQLKATLEGLNISYDKNKDAIDNQIKSLRQGTKWTRDELFDTYNKAIKITGNVTDGMRLLKVAMDTATGTGKDLNEVMSIFNMALASPERGMLILRREFGKLATEGKTTGEVILNLGKHFDGLAQKDETITAKTSELKDAWNDLTGMIGEKVAPAITFLLKVAMFPLVIVLTTINITLRTLKITLLEVERRLGAFIGLLTNGIKGAKEVWADKGKEISKEMQGIGDDIKKAYEKLFGQTVKANVELGNKVFEILKKETKKKKKEVEKELTDTEEFVKKIGEGMQNDLANAFDRAFKSVIDSGQFTSDTLKDVFTQIYQGFRDMLIKMVAEIIARAVFFQLLNIVTGGTGSLFGMSISSLFGATKGAFQTGGTDILHEGAKGAFQTGGTVPRTGNYILHEGETVIPAGANVNNETSSNMNLHLNINAFDIRTLDRTQIERIAKQITPYIKKNL